MEFLRCNKCYDHFESSSRKFCIIRCGHIFCDICWTKAASKCYECRMVSLNLLTLTKPLKLEMVMNYFSPATRFAEQTKKAMQFHDEQLGIALRGLGILEKKYERAKKCFEESIKAAKEEHDLYVKMIGRVNKLQVLLKARKAQSTGERHYVPPLANTNVVFPETPRKSDESSCSESLYSRTHRNDNISPINRVKSNVQQRRNFDESRSTAAKPRSRPGPFLRNAYNNETPKSIHDDGFVVPTMTKVPKSAIASGKKVSTKRFHRLSEPRFEHNTLSRANYS